RTVRRSWYLDLLQLMANFLNMFEVTVWGCWRSMSAAAKKDALRTWMHWVAEVLIYDRLERLTTVVTRKVVSRH
ncbi:hypothetical protein L195_g044734, partial [Trifolium pratense]